MESPTNHETASSSDLIAQLWNDEWLETAVQIEEESNCDISAGIDHGAHLGDYLRHHLQRQSAPLDPTRLMDLLQAELGEQLSSEDLEAIAADVQVQIQQRLGQST